MPRWGVWARHALVFASVLVVVLPGLFWITRLGDLSPVDTVSSWVKVCLPLVVTAMANTFGGLKLGGRPGAMLGAFVLFFMLTMGG